MLQCQYVGPGGVPCFDDAQDGRELCVWHDATIDKTGPEWARHLEALARDGQSLAGFELARAQLDGINLTFPDHATGVDLRGANLTRASLKGARLYRADFTGASLLKANLSEANLNAARFEDADLLGASFAGVHMEDTQWGSALRQDREAYAARKRGQHDLAAQNFREAEEIYRDLRIIAEAQGHLRISGEFFYREMLMRHHRLARCSMARMVSGFAHILYGYGERPSHIISCAAAYLLIFAFAYFALGVNDTGAVLAYDPARSFAENLVAFGDCLYFSIVTFTTVGYGDVVPQGLAKTVSAVEALSGHFVMALFVVVFVRKLAR